MKLSLRSRPGILAMILLAVIVAIICFATIFFYKATTPSLQTEKRTTLPNPALTQSSFSAEQFHSQIQIGMDYDNVVSLAAGQPGDCEMSSAPAPTDYMNCAWQDDANIVSVSFKDHLVTSKSLRDQ